MKAIFFALAMLCFTLSISAQAGNVETDGGIILGNNAGTADGTIKYDGNDFLGRTGGLWQSLTGGGGSSLWSQSGSNIFYNGGNVGIGGFSTASNLFVSSSSSSGEIVTFTTSGNLNANASLLLLKAGSSANANSKFIRALVGNDEPFFVRSNGNADFGSGGNRISLLTDEFVTTNFSAKLEMFDANNNPTVEIFSDAITNSGGALSLRNNNGSQTLYLDASYDNAASSGAQIGVAMGNQGNGVIIKGENGEGGDIKMYTDAGTEVIELDASPSSGGKLHVSNPSGDITIELDGSRSNASDGGGQLVLYDGAGVANVRLEAEENSNGGGHLQLRNGAGQITLDFDADYLGNGRVITDELEITGGSDFAENFDVIKTDFVPVPGMVVSIDPESTGKLVVSSEAYDTKVAGVISGANGVRTGMYMGQEGSIANGDYPIALTGRVYVYANNEGGVIRPGDMLTTSSVAGQAMKASDKDRAHGAIVGKAMTKVDENGFVFVLVNLQ